MQIIYDEFLESLNNDDVLQLFNQLFTVSRIKFALENSFRQPVPKNFIEQLQLGTRAHVEFSQGVDCRILKAGASGWKKGRITVNVSVKFIPDEPEANQYQSPLDEIRQEIQ
jgi:hypothetical protein